MKTIRQIADAIGVDKQRVYRYIRKNHISEAHQKCGVMWFGEAVETAAIQHFSGNGRISEAHHEAHQTTSSDTVFDTVIAMLERELEAKNGLISTQQRTISDLTAALEHTTASLHAAQALHAGTMQKQLAGDGNGKTERKGLFPRFFKNK